jgi:1-phosphofructokinase
VIVTLTANPSIDWTVELQAPLERGAVLRAADPAAQAAGKGVNISRAAVAAGIGSVAVVPAPERDPYVLEVRATGIDCLPVGPARPPRVNITVTEPGGTTTKINSPGPAATPELLGRLADAVAERARGAAWVVLAGSLPPATPAGWYADLVARVSGVAPVAVDTSGEPLAAVVNRLGDGAPSLLKPNAEELASVTGADAVQLAQDPVAAAKAARVLVDEGAGACLVTLGGAGAVLVTAAGAWHAPAPPTTVVSTVGAGDSSLFGYLLADLRGLAAPDKLRLAVAYGSAAAGLPGTNIPAPAQVRPERVAVAALDLTSLEHDDV